jgi:hypothetical protein
MESGGGGYAQQSNDEGVHGEYFFARNLYYNDDIDNGMTTIMTKRIQYLSFSLFLFLG